METPLAPCGLFDERDGGVLYNEIDEYAARWIGNLMVSGHIAPGVVDTRSIAELTAEDVRHARQAHFFAGIAVWSAALRLAGWPDGAPIWTGSCPCQPFSQAGRGKGTHDTRHLWPEWFRLIRECRPPVVVGEQVASPAGLGWLDSVFADLEGAGYTCAAADLCAAGVGAPHRRQRLYFVAIADGIEGRLHLSQWLTRRTHAQVVRCGEAGDPACTLADSQRDDGARRIAPSHGRATEQPDRYGDDGASDRGMANCQSDGRQERRDPRSEEWPGLVDDGAPRDLARVAEFANATGVTGGFWADADYVACRDPGRGIVYRPVEPGSFPLAHGATARVGRLRAYGNAIVRPQAQAFIEAVIEILANLDR